MRSSIVCALVLMAACGKKTPPEAAASAAPTTAAPAPAAEPAASTSEEAPAAPSAAPKAAPKGRSPVDVALDDSVALLGKPDEGAWMQARTALRKLTVEAPDAKLAWYNLGVAYHKLGAFVDAADAFTRCTRLDAEFAPCWRALGQVELQLGDPDLALRRFDRAIEVDPADVGARAAKIQALRDLGRSKAAIDEAKAALRVNALALPVYNLMGLAYLDANQPDAARFVYEKAETVEGAEDDAKIQANFGWTLKVLGEPYAAQVRLKRAVELDPDFVPGLVYLAQLYLEDRNYADMVPLLEKARKRAPDNRGVIIDLGIAYRGLGRTDDAKRAWDKALELDPSDPTPWFNLGILLGDDVKDYDAAISAFEKYVRAGGAESARAREYIEDVERERKKAERQREKEEARKKREAERAERERLLEQAEKKEQASPPAESGGGGGSPWDTQGGGGVP